MSTAAEEHVLSAAEMTPLKHSPDRRSWGCWAGVEWISTITQPTPSGTEMIGRPMLAVTETGECFSGVITAAEETESSWQYTLQQRPFEAPELHP